jgi:hypothetical protein
MLAAYRALAAGDARPLVDLLSLDVEWTQTKGLGRFLVVQGRERVAALLEGHAGDPRVAEFRGLGVRGDRFVLSFRQPWWEEHPYRLWRRLGASLDERFTQTIAFGTAVERLDCSLALAYLGQGWLERASAFVTLPDR